MTQGGYREGSGRSRSGYYNGIYCGSTYELCWVIYNIDHGHKFSRFPGRLEQDSIRYYPDFLLSDGKTIVEIKGYEASELVDRKTKVAESLGYTVIVLRKSDLKFAFDYVERKYKTKKFYTLYDQYKPIFTHICSQCSLKFRTDRKIATENKFCTRICAGKYRKANNLKSVSGSKYGRPKLSKEAALSIYNAVGKTLTEIAVEYNTSSNMVWFIKQKRAYKWIHE